MKFILDNINKMSYENNVFNIECDENIIKAYIIDGTVKIKVYNDDNNMIGINGLKINDSIKIYYKEINLNIIFPIKIIKLNNYIFNNMSSSSDNE